MRIMDDNVPSDIEEALIDWFEGWELVAFLDIPIEEVVTAFADLIIENLKELKEEMRFDDDPEDD